MFIKDVGAQTWKDFRRRQGHSKVSATTRTNSVRFSRSLVMRTLPSSVSKGIEQALCCEFNFRTSGGWMDVKFKNAIWAQGVCPRQVSFCVGSLTNGPLVRGMKPRKASGWYLGRVEMGVSM